MGLFEGVKDAKPIMDTNYVRAGHYIARIDKCKEGEARRSGKFAAVEMTILSVLDPRVEDHQVAGGDNKPPTIPHRIGEEVTHMVPKFGPGTDYFDGTIVHIISTTMEAQPHEVDEETANLVFGEQNALSGVVVEILARTIITREGNPFTRIKYVGPVKDDRLYDLVGASEIQRYLPAKVRKAESEA